MAKSFVYFMVLLLVSACGRIEKVAEPLNILIITDNRSFNREAFFNMFDSFENLKWTEMAHPEILDFFNSDSIKNYDALVFYDMPENVLLTEEQKQTIYNLFKGGIPAVFLHHSLLSYREWEDFRNIIGGRYYNKTPLIKKNGDTLQSVYQHDVSYRIKIADTTHPVTLGFEDFEIFDETYNDFYVKEDVTVLLTTDHPLSGPVIGWVNSFGNSKIVYLINGHNESAYENPHYRKLVDNAIKWVSTNNGIE